MKNKPKSMRNVLFALIRETAKNASAFVRDPERDFTRKRKLDMETMILILIGMEGIAPPDVLNQYVFSRGPRPRFCHARRLHEPADCGSCRFSRVCLPAYLNDITQFETHFSKSVAEAALSVEYPIKSFSFEH